MDKFNLTDYVSSDDFIKNFNEKVNYYIDYINNEKCEFDRTFVIRIVHFIDGWIHSSKIDCFDVKSDLCIGESYHNMPGQRISGIERENRIFSMPGGIVSPLKIIDGTKE